MKYYFIEFNLWGENLKYKWNVWKYESLDEIRKKVYILCIFFIIIILRWFIIVLFLRIDKLCKVGVVWVVFI